MRHARCLVILFLFVGIADTIRAERKYTAGLQIDFVSGGTNRPGSGNFEPGRLEQSLVPFFTVYPSFDFKSISQHSHLDFNYAFGLDRYVSEQEFNSESHSMGTSLTLAASKKVRLKFSDTFQATPDITSFNVQRGILFTSAAPVFLYDPIAIRRKSLSNDASATVEYELSPKSMLSLGAQHTLRNYEEIASFPGGLSDQYRLRGIVSYTRKLDEHRSWSLEYSTSYSDYSDFEDVRSQDLSFGYAHQLTPGVSLRLSAGPSYAQSLDSDRKYPGYNASIRVQKSIRSNQLSLHYVRRTADSTGLGSVSDTHNAGFGFNWLLGKRITLNFDVSAFQGRQRFDNPFNVRGISGTGGLAFILSKTWFLAAGGLYQRQEDTALLDVESKRIYLSLRYRAPELWRFAR
jgi:hypothetical protein